MTNATWFLTTNNPPCPIVRAFVDVFNIYIYGITPITIVGVIFNIITLFVLNSQKSNLNSIYLLKLLAISDMVFLIDCLFFYSIRHLSAYAWTGDEVFKRSDPKIGSPIFVAVVPIYFMAQQNRNWLVIIITVERFLNLMFPLWARATLTKRFVNYLFAANVVVSIGCNMYYYWAFRIVSGTDPCTGTPEMTIDLTEWVAWGREIDKYMYVIMTAILPLLLLYIMNITLIISLRRMFQRREGMTADMKETKAQKQATTMVLAITVLFTICETPASLDRIATFAGVTFAADDLFYNYGRKVGLLLVVLDSAVNFVAYVVSNRPFRRTLIQVFSRKKG